MVYIGLRSLVIYIILKNDSTFLLVRGKKQLCLVTKVLSSISHGLGYLGNFCATSVRECFFAFRDGVCLGACLLRWLRGLTGLATNSIFRDFLFVLLHCQSFFLTSFQTRCLFSWRSSSSPLHIILN